MIRTRIFFNNKFQHISLTGLTPASTCKKFQTKLQPTKIQKVQSYSTQLQNDLLMNYSFPAQTWVDSHITGPVREWQVLAWVSRTCNMSPQSVWRWRGCTLALPVKTVHWKADRRGQCHCKTLNVAPTEAYPSQQHNYPVWESRLQPLSKQASPIISTSALVAGIHFSTITSGQPWADSLSRQGDSSKLAPTPLLLLRLRRDY